MTVPNAWDNPGSHHCTSEVWRSLSLQVCLLLILSRANLTQDDAPCIVNMFPREVRTSRLWVRILPAKAQRWMTLFEPEGMHSGTVVSIPGEEWAFVRVKPIFDHPQTSVNSEESRLIGAHLIVSNRWSVRVWVFDGEAKAEVVLNDCGTLIFVVLLFHFACLSWSGIRSHRKSLASHF